MSNSQAQTSTPTAVPLAELAPGSWALDARSSSISFAQKGMWRLVTVKGTFSQIDGSGETSAGGAAKGTLTIGAASLDTKHGKRDTHLRSADFFDVEAHPSIVFTARRVTPTGRDTADVQGDLTIRGTIRPLTFTARATEASDEAVALTAEVSVERKDFGLNWNQFGMIKGKADLTLNLRFTRV